MALLECKGLNKSFNSVVAIDDVSFSLEEDKIYGLIGPNGAGKTTLFNVVSGFSEAESGTILFEDIDITNYKSNRIVQNGLVRTFQVPRVFDELSVLQNGRLGAHLHADKRLGKSFLFGKRTTRNIDADIQQALQFVNLDDRPHINAEDLSYGQQRRLQIAIAILAKPDLILLDEPLAGVDPKHRTDIVDLINQLHKNGITLMIIEHELREIMSLSDHIFVLNNGKIISNGKPDEIRNDIRVKEAYLGRSDTT